MRVCPNCGKRKLEEQASTANGEMTYLCTNCFTDCIDINGTVEILDDWFNDMPRECVFCPGRDDCTSEDVCIQRS